MGDTLRTAVVEVNKTRDYTDYSHVMASIAKALIQVGSYDEAIVALESIRENETRYYSLWFLLQELQLLANIENKSLALSKLLEAIKGINSDAHLIQLAAQIGEELSRLRHFRAARLAVSDCSSNDKLRVYATILSEYGRPLGTGSPALVEAGKETR